MAVVSVNNKLINNVINSNYLMLDADSQKR